MKTAKLVALVLVGLVIVIPAVAKTVAWIRLFSSTPTVASTIPANGDLNPYGVAVVPRTRGILVRNNVLVSNFNNSSNLQGTGTTIVQISPTGQQTLFAQLDPVALGLDPQAIGLTTALVALKKGWVIVGSLPTTDGTSATATDGQIFILNSNGTVVLTLSGDLIHGPWDAAIVEKGNRVSLFVTMVLDGTVAASPNIVNNGTIVRIDLLAPQDIGTNAPTEISRTVIASGFPQRTDPDALVIGPTGLAYGPGDKLYVANTLMNEVRVIRRARLRTDDAGLGDLVMSGGALNQPLGLMLTPVTSLLIANGGDGNMVEISRKGEQLAVKTINADGAGTLFGLAKRPVSQGVYFVDDGANTLRVLEK